MTSERSRATVVQSGSERPATADPSKLKPAKLGAEKLTPEEQRRRFEELAREAGCDEGSDARFEAAVTTIARTKPKSS